MRVKANTNSYGVRAGTIIDVDPVLWAGPIAAGKLSPVDEYGNRITEGDPYVEAPETDELAVEDEPLEDAPVEPSA